VLIQASGERGPTAAEAASEEHVEGLGRAALSTVDALDAAPDVSQAMQSGLLVQHKTFPGWALRLLAATLLLGPLIVAVDALARLRRRGLRAARWTLWTLACAVPFLASALFARLLGVSGVIGLAPPTPPPPSALKLDATAVSALVSVALVFALGWLMWPLLLRRLQLTPRPDLEATGVAALLVLLAVALFAWAVNPVAALLVLPAAHVWLLVVSPDLRPGPRSALALVAVALLPLALLIAFYARELGLGPGQLAWTAVLLLAGGHVGIVASIAWSVALGSAAGMAMLAARTPPPPGSPELDEPLDITIRGPLTYAGPGSLGGTESALRR
jgi:hypothetical protein